MFGYTVAVVPTFDGARERAKRLSRPRGLLKGLTLSDEPGSGTQLGPPPLIGDAEVSVDNFCVYATLSEIFC